MNFCYIYSSGTNEAPKKEQETMIAVAITLITTGSALVIGAAYKIVDATFNTPEK